MQNTIDLANSWGAANVFTEGACDPTDPACTGVDREVTIAASAAGISWTHYQCEATLARWCYALANQARNADNGYYNVPCSEGENTCGGANKCSPGEPCAFGACIT